MSPAEYYGNCCCFCGCSEMCGPSLVPLRGHVECQKCFDGECTTEHYDKNYSIEAIAKRSREKLDAATDAMKAFENIFTRIKKP